jgi:uncharacterized protein (TIGR02271 family)
MARKTQNSKVRVDGAAKHGHGEEIIIPVVDEQLEVSKRRVVSGRVRVKKTVQHRTETVDVPVTSDHVEVKHVKVDREVEEIPPVREEGNTTIIPVVEEVVVVTKKLVLREEIHLVRTEKTETATQDVELATEQVEISRLSDEEPLPE